MENGDKYKEYSKDCYRGHIGQMQFFKRQKSNGTWYVEWRCKTCGSMGSDGKGGSHQYSYKEFNLDLLPLFISRYEQRPNQPCFVCGDQFTELHHFAPRYLFPDWDKWPTCYLCIKHHHEWHDRVTPYMPSNW